MIRLKVEKERIDSSSNDDQVNTAPGPDLQETGMMSERRVKAACAVCPKEGELARVEARVGSLEERAEDIYQTQLRLLAKLDELIPAVARLEVKAGVWGGVGGILAALAVFAAAIASRM